MRVKRINKANYAIDGVPVNTITLYKGTLIGSLKCSNDNLSKLQEAVPPSDVKVIRNNGEHYYLYSKDVLSNLIDIVDSSAAFNYVIINKKFIKEK